MRTEISQPRSLLKRSLLSFNGTTLSLINKLMIPFPSFTDRVSGMMNLVFPVTLTVLTHDHRLNPRSTDNDQSMLFNSIENGFERLKLPGIGCLQRIICEASATPEHDEGLLGDIIDLILNVTETGGHHEKLNIYWTAQQHGKTTGSCTEKYRECPVSIFDYIHY
ncbi:Uncharacterised protein g6900 [Pycnogonum litorale]